MHYWADLQSVHELRCYGNIMRTRNVSEYMLVLALCLVKLSNSTCTVVGLLSGNSMIRISYEKFMSLIKIV